MKRFTIQAENLSKRFNREWIFKNLNYKFSSGNIYAITGPNGSGKSTFLQVMWGQVPQTTGNFTYENSGAIIPTEEIYNHISIATPYMDLIDEFTLLEHLNFHFKLKGIRNGISTEDLLDVMYLKYASDKQVGNFSSGMKQRLKLGLAFYTESDIFFLDEPGTNLDQQAFDWYYRELTGLPDNKLIFIATNNIEEYPKDSIIINIMDFKR
jgi:ABC-type multidrug transport system ATPase subunit